MFIVFFRFTLNYLDVHKDTEIPSELMFFNVFDCVMKSHKGYSFYSSHIQINKKIIKIKIVCRSGHPLRVRGDGVIIGPITAESVLEQTPVFPGNS